jgi:fibronectin type 3 domain-containing protein
VDDFRIYVNALPASDVLALFNGTAGALAGPWTSQDIGSPSIPGNSGSLGDDIYVTASGSDIWGGSDQFHYVSRTWTGDGTLTARVNGVTVTNTWIKAGLMFRESLDANARNALISTLPGNYQMTFQSRSSTGGGSTGTNIDVPAAPPAGPYWLKLQRVGNVFTGYHSADGVTWTQTGTPVTLSLPTTCYVGFAVASNNNTRLTAAQFDHISLNASAPATPTGLTATAGNAEIVLNWSAGSDATSYTVKRATVSGGPYTTVANVATTSYTDTGLASGTTYHYVVAANNVYGVSPDSTEASAITITQLTGAVIGSSGSWGNLGNTTANVFDGNVTTFYDAVNGTGDWAGLDLGSGAAAIVKQIKYCPRPGFASRMVGGEFQGSNVADFSSGVVTLFTVASTPPDGTMTMQTVTNGTGFRYLRYIGPANAYCDVAEVEFDGFNAAIPSVPTNLVAAPGNAQVALTWNTASGATSYNVKRATVSGGSYTTIASGITSTSYTNTGLSNGTTYYYVVSAVNAGGESANSAQTSATPEAPPATPGGLAATAGNAQVGLNWNTSSGATSYNVKRATVNGGPYTTITSVTGTGFTDTGLTNGTTYYYVVSASNSGGESGDSIQASATPLVPVPPAPAGLVATGGDAQAVLSWNASAGATSYNVKRATVSGGPYSTIGNLTDTSFTNTGLTNGTTYYYVVSALGIGGEGANSAQASATPQVPAPPAPAGLVATGGDAQVALTWNASSGAASYNVKRSTVSGGPYSTITNITGTSFTNTGLTNGTTYYYVVSAVNAGAESADSAQASATPSSPLPSPWVTADIGAVAAAGSASASGGTFTVTGSGADIWGTADEFRYTYQTSSGNCEMRAQVTSVQNTDPWAKAGVMIRESTAAGARYAAVFISPGNGVTFQRRTTTGGTTVNTVVSGVTAPRYVRLQRASNNSFRAYYSSNGTSWTQIGANQSISMAGSATMGLAVTSHIDGTLCTSTISNVTATP